MRAQAALLVLILAACSGPSAAPSAAPDSVASPSTAVSTGSTACAPARDPIAPPSGESVTAAIALGCEGGAVAVTGGSVWVVRGRIRHAIDPSATTVRRFHRYPCLTRFAV